MTIACVAAVEYCINNVDDDTRERLLAGGPAIIESMCLQRCGHCYAGPFLVVDGALVEGDSHDELLRHALPAAAREGAS